jgi:DNA-binding response OmpR family regulator
MLCPRMGKKVLVVDDSQLVLEAIRLVLTEAGFEVTTLQEPSKVVEVASRVVPDLVLVDVRMPELGGPAVTRLLRAELDRPELLILLHSDMSNEELARMAVLCNASGTIKKSPNFEELVAELKGWLAR